MGAPLSMYELLLKVDNHGWGSKLPFKLYAILLFDRNHPHLAAQVQAKLVTFHKQTGKDVLFFVPQLIEFPPELQREVRNFNTRYLNPQEWGGEWGAIFDPHGDEYDQKTHRSIKRVFDTDTICTRLDLEPNEIPCIVVATDLMARNFYVIPLAEAENAIFAPIEKIMQQLTNNAFLLRTKRVLFSDLVHDNQLMRILQAERESRYRLVEVLIAAAESERSPIKDFGEKIRRLVASYEVQAREYQRMKKICEESGLDTADLYQSEENMNKEARAVWNYLAHVYSQLSQKQYVSDAHYDFRNASKLFQKAWAGVEPESLKYLKTAGQICAAIMNLHISHDLNYAPLISVISQLVELEWNLSFVHMIRAACGVTLPGAFALHDNAVGRCEVISNNHRVLFNRPQWGAAHKWLPPGMGESRTIFEKASKDSTAEALTPSIRLERTIREIFSGHNGDRIIDQDIERMLALFGRLGSWRNKASHGGTSLDKHDFEKVCALVVEMEYYVTTYFVKLKQHYRGT